MTAIKSEFRALSRVVRDRADLATIGIRALRLPDLAGRPLVVMAGLAGGLDPSLAVGDVVVDAESSWRATPLPYRRVRCAWCEHVAASVDEKARLFRETGAGVVEMEGARVREACRRAGVPFLGLRAVSDAADDAIDPAVLRFVDPFGGVKVGALIGGVARRPALVKDLRKLARASSVALANLATAVDLVLRQGER